MRFFENKTLSKFLGNRKLNCFVRTLMSLKCIELKYYQEFSIQIVGKRSSLNIFWDSCHQDDIIYRLKLIGFEEYKKTKHVLR